MENWRTELIYRLIINNVVSVVKAVNICVHLVCLSFQENYTFVFNLLLNEVIWPF